MGEYDELAKELAADAKAYRHSVYADDTDEMFTLAYQWQDKPLRHIHNLCDRIEIAATAITTLVEENARLREKRDTLFDVIKHGDQEHQDWLRDAITRHFNGETQ